jgi:hypothetical protein
MDAKDGKQRRHTAPRREVQCDRIELAMKRGEKRDRVRQQLKDALTPRFSQKERDAESEAYE